MIGCLLFRSGMLTNRFRASSNITIGVFLQPSMEDNVRFGKVSKLVKRRTESKIFEVSDPINTYTEKIHFILCYEYPSETSCKEDLGQDLGYR
jgi:hypothetical protein